MKDKEVKAEAAEELKIETPAAPKAKVVKAGVPEKEPAGATATDLIYLGPTIDGVARVGDVYKDGILPQKAQKCAEEFPPFRQLFVETARTGEVLKEFRSGAGSLCEIYRLTKEKFKGGK